MSLKIQGGIVHIGTYNDNSREYHVTREDLSSFTSELDSDIPSPEDLSSVPSEKIVPPVGKETVSDTTILSIPGERKYSEVRTYIKERCRFDAEFKEYVESHSRVELCQRLSNEFGWFVDDHKLGVNMNRHRN